MKILPDGQSERLYGALVLIGFLLRETSPGSTWLQKVRGLIESDLLKISMRKIVEMGFPAGWEKSSIWN